MKETRSVKFVITALVVGLSVLVCVLIFLIPSDSMIVDLVYQGF